MSFSLSDITFLIRLLLDILVVWELIYSGLRIVRNNSRTIQLVKGVLIIVLVKALAVWLGLNALNYLIEMFLNWGVVVILVVFQPEIRGMLEKVGKTTAILTTDVSYDTIQYGRKCPYCKSEHTVLLQGNECLIKEIEAE